MARYKAWRLYEGTTVVNSFVTDPVLTQISDMMSFTFVKTGDMAGTIELEMSANGVDFAPYPSSSQVIDGGTDPQTIGYEVRQLGSQYYRLSITVSGGQGDTVYIDAYQKGQG